MFVYQIGKAHEVVSKGTFTQNVLSSRHLQVRLHTTICRTDTDAILRVLVIHGKSPDSKNRMKICSKIQICYRFLLCCYSF